MPGPWGHGAKRNMSDKNKYSMRKKNKYCMNALWFHLYVKFKKKKAKLIETESKIVVPRGWGWEEWEDVGQRVQISNCEMSKEGSTLYHVDYS